MSKTPDNDDLSYSPPDTPKIVPISSTPDPSPTNKQKLSDTPDKDKSSRVLPLKNIPGPFPNITPNEDITPDKGGSLRRKRRKSRKSRKTRKSRKSRRSKK